MGKISNRDRILSEGLRVVHAQGFAGASVRDIVSAAGVPQGSFTNHFVSKEAFGLEVLNLYYADVRARMTDALLDESLAPVGRIRKWIGSVKRFIAESEMKAGCMFGNFSAEATNCDGIIRLRLTEIFSEMQSMLVGCLEAAIKDGELPQDCDVIATAGFILFSVQGAILLSKAHRNITPLDQLEQILFSKVLR